MPERQVYQERPNFIKLYIPCRTAIVLIAEENLSKDIQDELGIKMPPIEVVKKQQVEPPVKVFASQL